MQELNEAWEVCVIDLCWGRERYLWEVLANEFCVMLTPHKGWSALGRIDLSGEEIEPTPFL